MTDPMNTISTLKFLPSPQGSPKGSASKPDDKGLEKACQDFESLFVNYLMQTMRSTIPENSLFGGGQAEKIYTGMLDNELAKSISLQRGIGLAALLYAQMSSEGHNGDTKK